MRPGELELRRPDAILEKDVGERIREFTLAGGRQEDVGRHLSENYVGYAEMVNLIGDWLDETGLGSSEGLTGRAMEEVVRCKFLPSKADHALSKLERPPEFLEEVFESERWWPVIKGLKRMHRGCALLQHLDRKKELREITGEIDVTESFVAFQRVLSKEISDCLQSPDLNQDSLIEMQKRVTKLAVYDERSFILALRMLASAEVMCTDKRTASILRRISQEIRIGAVEEMTRTSNIDSPIARQWVAKYAVMFECITRGLPIRKGPLETLLFFVFSESKSKSFASEINTLNKTYEVIWDGRDESSIRDRKALLTNVRQPEILHAIHQSLFSSPRDTRNREGKRKCLCMLLACASVPVDGSAAEQSSIEDRLLKVTAIAAKLKPGCSAYEMKPHLPCLKEYLEVPVVAAGMLHWAREGILKQPRPHTLKVTLSYYLSITDYIARLHPVFRPDVVKLLRDAFESDFKTGRPQDNLSDPDLLFLHSQIAKGLVNLTRMGCATDIVRFYGTKSAVLDASMIRHFVRDLLKVANPPFTQAFGHEVLKYISTPKVLDITRKDLEANKLITSFVKSCTEQGNLVVPHVIINSFSKEINLAM